jgi:hypothetical protein
MDRIAQLLKYIAECEQIAASEDKTDKRHENLFYTFNSHVQPLIEQTGLKFEYKQPDTKGPEIKALIKALTKLKAQLLIAKSF